MKSAIIVLLSITLLIAACSHIEEYKTDNGHFKLQLIMKSVFKAGKNNCKLMLTDGGGMPVSGADIEITPWMPSMGHGSMLIPQVGDLGGGKYAAKDIQFIMSGEWELRLKIKKGDVTDKTTLKYKIE